VKVKNAGWQPALRMGRGDFGLISAAPYKRAGRDASGTYVNLRGWAAVDY